MLLYIYEDLKEACQNLPVSLAGVSVRRVEDITEALWGTKVSPSTISNLNKKAYEHIETWRTRPLVGSYPYVYVDGVHLKHSWGMKSKTFLSLLPSDSAPMAAVKSSVQLKV